MKILIADDSIIARQGIKSMVAPLGVELIEAQNGEEAYKVIVDDNPDCILLDLLMPVMTGIEVLQKIECLNQAHKIIVISADVQLSTLEQCSKFGVSNFLNKPPVKQDLLDSIRRIVYSENT